MGNGIEYRNPSLDSDILDNCFYDPEIAEKIKE